MLGAIAGDIIGSVHERAGTKTTDFILFDKRSRFTDDTVLTTAVADSLMNGLSYSDTYRNYTLSYPDREYGGNFWRWANGEPEGPYNSWGNGSAMRVSSIGWMFDSMESVLVEAERSAVVTHDHPEGVKGAQAVAAAVFLARNDVSKADIRKEIVGRFGYDLDRTVKDIRPDYQFDVSCQGSVPESIIAFLNGDDYEETVRLAVSMGGDADTMAAIAGGIAEAFYGGVPDHIAKPAVKMLDRKLRRVLKRFWAG